MPGRPVRRAELLLSLGVLALGVSASVVAFRLPDVGGYARIGPNFVPRLVAGGLVVMGLWLLAEVATGGWRDAVDDDPSARGEHPFHLPSFAWVSAGLFAQMALIQHAGFVVAATALFSCVSRGFGSTRPARDAALGFVLALAIYLFFVRFLNVSLPAGWLASLLGVAGL
jgi:putative tricarboxylic transport membrane protein